MTPLIAETVLGSACGILVLTMGAMSLISLLIIAGLVTPLIAETVLGSADGILVLTMGAIALISLLIHCRSCDATNCRDCPRFSWRNSGVNHGRNGTDVYRFGRGDGNVIYNRL